VFVMSEKDYAEWLNKGGNRYKDTPMTMQEAGRQLFEQKGCGGCHTNVDNQRAPTLVGIYNTNRTMEDGSTLKADEEYL
ncbi:c-type cytochrome, partial [Acinetobacter baumannii]